MRQPITPERRRFLWIIAIAVLLSFPSSRLFAQVSLDVPLDGVPITHPCSGEPVTLHGHASFTINESTSPDGTVTIKIHVQSQGVSATTSASVPGSTPRKYVSSYVDDQTLISRITAPTVNTITTNWQFIRTGEDDGLLCCGDDWHVKMTFHFTEQPGGMFTAFVDNFSAECR